MQDVDIVAQQALGMKGCLLIEDEFSRVAAIDLSATIGTEEGVGLIYATEVRECHALAAVVVADEPYVGLLATVEHGLEGEGYRAALGIIGKEIAATGIVDKLSHSATATGHIPRRAVLGIEEHGGT